MRWSVFAKLVLIEQTLFGLPWVIASVFLPFGAVEPSVYAHSLSWSLGFYILMAFIAARTAGMAFNRLIDRHIDAANPRTKDRPLPAGEVSLSQVQSLALISIAIFVVCCAQINTLCLMLSPIAVLLLWIYSYTKRFTVLCHFVLGLIHFLVPIFSWAAVTANLAWPPVFLGLAALCSISAADIIYAGQDALFDRQYKLYSIPAFLSRSSSLRLAKVLHGLAFFFFILLGSLLHLNWIYFLGTALIAIIYQRLYRTLQSESISPLAINRLFFMCNSAVSLIFMFFTLGSIAWLVLL